MAGVMVHVQVRGVVQWSDHEAEVLYSFLLDRNNLSNGILKLSLFFK